MLNHTIKYSSSFHTTCVIVFVLQQSVILFLLLLKQLNKIFVFYICFYKVNLFWFCFDSASKILGESMDFARTFLLINFSLHFGKPVKCHM